MVLLVIDNIQKHIPHKTSPCSLVGKDTAPLHVQHHLDYIPLEQYPSSHIKAWKGKIEFIEQAHCELNLTGTDIWKYKRKEGEA